MEVSRSLTKDKVHILDSDSTRKSKVLFEQETGIIKWFSSKKRYGYIIPDNGGREVFFHESELRLGDINPEQIPSGQKISFLRYYRGGKIAATNLLLPINQPEEVFSSVNKAWSVGTISDFDFKRGSGSLIPTGSQEQISVSREVLKRGEGFVSLLKSVGKPVYFQVALKGLRLVGNSKGESDYLVYRVRFIP